jgi:hypothetical protein
MMKAHGYQMYRNHAAAFEQTNSQIAAAFLVRMGSSHYPVLDKAWALVDNLELEDE